MSYNKTGGSTKYIGVYHKNDDTWVAKLTKAGKLITFGPFETDREAAKKYDEEVLKIYPNRTKLNFPNKEAIEKNNTNRIMTLRKNFDKNLGKRKLSKTQQNKELYIRQTFPTAVRNLICSRQKWKCNFCVDTLSDIFIIDHMVPLFLGGSNANHNLQALCPSCDRYKTSYLDHKILKPLHAKNGKITAEEVGRLQNDHYHKKQCQDPDEINDDEVETIDDDAIVESDEKKIRQLPKRNKITKNAERDFQGTTTTDTETEKPVNVDNKANEVEIKVGKTLIRVSSI